MTVIDSFDIWGEPDENGVTTLNNSRPEAGAREVHDSFSRNINENMLDLGIREYSDVEDVRPFIYGDADFNQDAVDAEADIGRMDRQVGGDLRFACRGVDDEAGTSILVHGIHGLGWMSVLLDPYGVSE